MFALVGEVSSEREYWRWYGGGLEEDWCWWAAAAVCSAHLPTRVWDLEVRCGCIFLSDGVVLVLSEDEREKRSGAGGYIGSTLEVSGTGDSERADIDGGGVVDMARPGLG
jgi:hypothetical protein